MNKLMKSIFLVISTVLLIVLLTTVSQARIVTDDPTVKSGETVKITVSSQENLLGYKVYIKSNSGLTFKSASGGSYVDNDSILYTALSPTKSVGTYTFKAPEVTKETKYTVVFQAEGVIIEGKEDEETSSSATATVTVTPNPSDNEEQLTFTSKDQTVYAIGEVNIRSNHSTSSSILGSLDEGDSVKRIGIADKRDGSGILWSKVKYNGQTAYVSSDSLTTTKPVVKEETKNEEKKEEDKEQKKEEKSKNVNLKTLEVTPTGLGPAFSNMTTEYTMTVGSDIDKIEIKAIPEDEKAKVSISGNNDLEIGANTIKIKVTAEDGTERTYVITVTKEEKEQLKLSELLVEGLPLTPEFDENIYEYSISLDKSDVSKLNITATPSEKNAEIEIVGNTELKPGDNVITILVKSSEGEEITTYQITATIPAALATTTLDNDNLYMYIGIGVVVLVLLIITIVIIRKVRKNKENDYSTYYGMYNNEDGLNNIIDNKKEEVKLEDLPKLTDDDLPKSLRKEKNEEEKVLTGVEENIERNKKIDELYSMSTEDVSRRKKGKHF